MNEKRAPALARPRRAAFVLGLVAKAALVAAAIVLCLVVIHITDPDSEAVSADAHVLMAHHAMIDCLAYASEGRWLALSAWDKTMMLLSARDDDGGERIHFHRMEKVVKCLAVSPDGSLLALGYYDGRAELWTVDPGQLHLAMSWRVDPGRARVEHDDPGGIVRSIDFSPDGRTLATVTEDTSIRLWEVPTGTLKSTLSIDGVKFSRIAFSPDGRTLASAHGGGRVVLWDWPTERTVADLRPALPLRYPEVPLAFSADGKLLAVGNVDRATKLCEVATGRYARGLSYEDSLIRSIAFSPDGRLLVTAGADGSLACWEAATGKPLVQLREHRGMVNAVAFSRDGEHLASAGVDGTVRLWVRGVDFPALP